MNPLLTHGATARIVFTAVLLLNAVVSPTWQSAVAASTVSSASQQLRPSSASESAGRDIRNLMVADDVDEHDASDDLHLSDRAETRSMISSEVVLRQLRRSDKRQRKEKKSKSDDSRLDRRTPAPILQMALKCPNESDLQVAAEVRMDDFQDTFITINDAMTGMELLGLTAEQSKYILVRNDKYKIQGCFPPDMSLDFKIGTPLDADVYVHRRCSPASRRHC